MQASTQSQNGDHMCLEKLANVKIGITFIRNDKKKGKLNDTRKDVMHPSCVPIGLNSLRHDLHENLTISKTAW